MCTVYSCFQHIPGMAVEEARHLAPLDICVMFRVTLLICGEHNGSIGCSLQIGQKMMRTCCFIYIFMFYLSSFSNLIFCKSLLQYE